MNDVGRQPASTQTELDAIRALTRSSNYFYEQVRMLSNHIGPRLSGSPQAAAAVAYVRRQMQSLGLNARLEPVTVRHWTRGREEACLVSYPGQADGTEQRVVVTALGNTVGTPPEGITARVKVVSTFEELDRLSAAEVAGTIVLFNHALDRYAARAGRWEQAYKAAVRYRSDGPSRAALKGARAALVRSIGSSASRVAHTGLTTFASGAPEIPAGAVTAEDAELIAYLATRDAVTIRLVLTPQDLPAVQSYNVVADLPGSNFPEQVIIVSGHLDSWDLGTGALDDAAGVGVAMDVLRTIQMVNPCPRRTIRFVAWMNEENGVAGGRAYAEDHKDELRNHAAAVELDYGDGRPLGLKVHGSKERLAPIAGILSAIAEPIGGLITVDDSPAVDIGPLNKAGVPCIAPLQDAREYFNYHHTAADTFDKVRPDELRRTLEVIASLVYALAQRE